MRRRADAALQPLALSAGNHTDIKVAILLITFPPCTYDGCLDQSEAAIAGGEGGEGEGADLADRYDARQPIFQSKSKAGNKTVIFFYSSEYEEMLPRL